MPTQNEVFSFTDHNRIALAVKLGAPASEVWAALTEAAAIHIWWGDYVSLEARDGGRFRERWTDGSGEAVTTTGRVIRFEPESTLELTWQDEAWDVPTQVTFILETLPDGTRLALEHRGFGAFSEDERAELIEDHAAGWTRHLQALVHYLQAT